MDEAAPSAQAAWLPMGAADEVLGLGLRMWGPGVAPNGDEGDASMAGPDVSQSLHGLRPM